MFYAAVDERMALAAIDRYLRQPPNNKPWSLVGDSAFQKSNKVLNAICKQMMQDRKVGLTIHKNRANNYNSCTKQGNSASGIPWIRLNSSALHGFTSPFISVKGGMKIRESSPETCWFFGVHLKGEVTMSFAATLHPKIIKVVWQITLTNPMVKCLRFLIQRAARWKPLKASLNTWILACRLCFNNQEKCQQSSSQKKMKLCTAIPLSAKGRSKTWWKTCQHLPG